MCISFILDNCEQLVINGIYEDCTQSERDTISVLIYAKGRIR